MRIALGTSDFRTLRREGYDYVDKSLLIRDIIDEAARVVLLPRPRRFGKTLNLSMLRCYLERPAETQVDDPWPLFAELAIAQAGERYRAHFQRYPTIHVNFKDIKDATWAQCLASTAALLSKLYEEHTDVLPKLDPWQKRRFMAVLEERAEEAHLQNALKDLSDYLARHHGQPVLVLLDEYDTPLHTAHLAGYYESALGFYRTLLSAVLKDNVNLDPAVKTPNLGKWSIK